VTEEGEVVDLGPIHLTAGSDATIKPTVEHSSAEGAQAFSIERRKHDQRVAAEEHKREEQRKNNELRWHQEKMRFYAVLFVLGLAFIFGIIAGVFADNTGTRRFGQGVVTLIVGGIVGYPTGRSGK